MQADDTAARGILVLSLGGTIAMTAPADGGAVIPALGAADLLRAIPELASSEHPLSFADVRRIPGASLGLDDLREVISRAGQHVLAGGRGVVVTQGTDSIEETAFALDLMWRYPQPLVVTGAMRNAAQSGADGPANLLAAVRVAAAESCSGFGCLVVMADEIHSASWVRKTHAHHIGAFTSPGAGPVGTLAEGEVLIFHRPASRGRPAFEATGRSARVALITATLGDDGALLTGLEERFEGVVVAGFGVGHVPESYLPALDKLAQAVPVVLSSRAGVGVVHANTYGFAGSETDLLRRGLIRGGVLDPLKARILLQMLIMAGATRLEIEEAFASSTKGWQRGDGA